MMNKQVPNLLSALRILSCVLFFLIGENAALFLMLVAFIGLTDLLDGYLARKYQCQSDLGAQLDSIGDLAFFVSLLVFICAHDWVLIRSALGIFLATVGFKTIPLAASLIRHRKILFIHTILNKLSGITTIFGLIALFFLRRTEIAYAMSGFIILASAEETIIHLTRENPDKNTPSLLKRVRPKI
jgi:phosphatidylglycerophosphate synthase